MKKLLLVSLLGFLMSAAFCNPTSSMEYSRASQNYGMHTNLLDDTEPPSVPTGLVVSEITATTIDLKWNPSTDNVHVFGYEIYKDGAWAGATVDTFLTVANLPSGSTFNITISAFDDANNLSLPSGPLSVTTPGAPDTEKPSVPTGLVASNVTETSFTISWNPSADNVGIAFYEIYQNGGWLGGTADTSFNITGLLPTSSYTFKVAAYDAAGNSSGTGAPLVIGAVDTEAPSIPQNLTATEIQANSVILSWDASTDNNGTPAYQYYINDQWVGGTSDLFKIVPGLTCGTTYKFAVDAYDGASPANISAQSNPISVTTLACAIDTEPPSVPTGLVASNITETTVDLSWAASTDNVSVHGYQVYIDGNYYNGTVDLTMTVSGLTKGTAYNFSVDAFDWAEPANVSAACTPISITTAGIAVTDTEPPTVPTGLVASNITATTVDLSWAASTDNVSVHGYQVYVNGNWYNGTVDLSMTVSGLTKGTSYNFTVDAFDWATPANISAPSAPLNVTTIGDPPPPDTEKPSSPTGLAVSNIAETTIDLKWNPSTDNVHVFGYEIYRNGNWAGATVDTFLTVTGLPPGTTFNITVSAFDDSNNLSIPSAPLSVTTLGTPPPPDTEKPSVPTGLIAYDITQTSVTLSWNPSTDNVHVFGYEIYKNGGWAGATIDTFLVLKDLPMGSSFNISVSSFDDSNNLSAPCTSISVKLEGDSDTQAPTVPDGLVASSVTETTFKLSWTAATDNVHVFGYEVFQDGVWVGATTETSLDIIDLECGKSYNMQVNAFDDAGNISEKSAALPVSTTECIIDALPATLNAGISVWPNPVSSILHMKGVPADAIISLCTVDGKLISRSKANGKVSIFDVSRLKKGIYFIKVQSGSQVNVEKIVVE